MSTGLVRYSRAPERIAAMASLTLPYPVRKNHGTARAAAGSFWNQLVARPSGRRTSLTTASGRSPLTMSASDNRRTHVTSQPSSWNRCSSDSPMMGSSSINNSVFIRLSFGAAPVGNPEHQPGRRIVLIGGKEFTAELAGDLLADPQAEAARIVAAFCGEPGRERLLRQSL